jgi:hypothetical protein
MRNWRMILATALILGSVTSPLVVRAHGEEQGEGDHKAHHSAHGTQAHKGMKKEAKTENEAKKTNTAAEEGAGEPHHDGHDMQGSSLGDLEEGSH